MKRYLAVLLFFCFFAGFAGAQELFKSRRVEAIAGLGTSQFFGDIGGYSNTENVLGFKDIILSQTRFNVEGALRYRFLSNVAAKLSLTFGMFHSIDETGSNETRGMEATTAFFEPALTGEFYFIKSNKEGSYLYLKGRNKKFSSIMQMIDIYAFTGIGGLSYNVKENDVLAAKGMPDSGFTAVIPAGIAANFILPDYNFGIEIGGRYAFSDYLDGYTSQYSKSNDVYYFLTFTFTYKIPTLRNGMPKFLSKRRF
jgi:hypothetical protein